MSESLNQVMACFPWYKRWVIYAMKYMVHLPTDEDTIKFCLAAWHCGWPRVRCASRQAVSRRWPVKWRTIRPFLPCPTVAHVELKFSKLTEEKTTCYEA